MENSIERKSFCEIQEPSVKYKESYISALKEFHKEGRNLDIKEEEIEKDFPNFIQRLKDESLGLNLKPTLVPNTIYWIVDKEGYVGRISLRHKLNEKLLENGGNIGYEVKPSKRGQGYGSKALELVLPKARSIGLTKVLLTCDSTNLASKKIIESNGGILENEVPGLEGEPSKLRYWIDL